MRFKNLLISFVIVLCISTTWSAAQTVERGHEAASGTVNFTALATYLLAHPEPLVIKTLENDDDDDEGALTVHPVPTDPSTIHARTGTGGAYVPGGLGGPPMLPVSPPPTDTFESTIDNITSIPPDTHGAVDSNYCVTAINSAVTIQTRAGGSVSSVSLDAFWSPVLPGGGSFDPRVHYDLYTHRWILIAVSGSFSTSSAILIAVSQTSNPTGSWNEFIVTADASGINWLDFPDIGYNNKWITISGNLFTNSGGSFTNAKIFAFNKADLLAGSSATYTAFNMADGSFTLCPALTYDATLGNMFFVESWNGPAGYMKIWKMTGAVGSESMSSVGYPSTSATWWNTSYTVSGTPGADFAPQASTSNLIQTNDDRVDQVIFINGKLWFSHTVFLPYSSSANPTRSSVQWWQTDTLANPIQIGLIDDASGANFYAFPSLAVNKNDDALIGFAAFSATTYPSGAYAMRLHTDATDSIRPLDVFRHGLASYYKTYSGTKNRWGDYSGTCLDPLDQTNFWTIQEASTTPGSGYDRWDTYWANVLIPCSTPASITGTLNVCVSSTTTLADATSGGTWSSSSTAIATVGTTGVVSGVSAGTATITYSTGTGCNATASVTVNALPTTITGTASVCAGSTTTLSSTPTGGTWTSATTGVATIGSGTGIVSGVSAGNSNITYTLSTGCLVSTTVTVNTAPGAITGTMSVCVSGTTTLSSSPGGGTWSSSDITKATVGSSSGAVTGVAAGTPTITYTLSDGCISTTTVTVVANPTITVGSTVCVGSTIPITFSPGPGTWSSSSPSVATVGSAGTTVSGLSAGTTIISYTVSSSGCSAAATVSVIATPSAITGTLAICTGSTSTLSSSPTGGTWSSSNTAIATVGSSSGIVLGAAVGTATITYTVSSGCYSTATVTVSTAPSAITGTLSVCAGSTTTLSSSPGGGTWTSVTTGVATIGSGSGVVSGVSAGTSNITYTLSGGCFSNTTVTVNTTAGAITGTVSVCVGSTTTLSSSPGGGTWTSSSTGVATVGSSSGVVLGISAGTANITYTPSDGCFATTAVTVATAPSAITGTLSVCAGSTTTLSSSPGGGTWTSVTTGVATIGSGSGVVSGVSVGTSNITYTLSGGCFSNSTVTVNASPAAITGPGSVCFGGSGGSTTLSDVTTSGAWSSSNSAVATVGSGTGVVTGVIVGDTATIYYTLGDGCFAAHPVTVVISPTFITGPSIVCSGNTVTLSDPTGGGSWTSSNVGQVTINSSGIATGVAFGCVTISYTIGSCYTTHPLCDSTSPASITGSSTACVGSTDTLSSSPGGGTWTSSSTGIATIGSANGVVSGVSTGAATITYTIGNGCYVTYTVTVNSVGAISGPSSVCSGGLIALTDTSTGGSWFSGDVTVATVLAPFGVVTGVSAGFSTLITYSLPSGCYATYPVSVTAAPGAISGTTTLCAGTTTTLSCSPGGGIWESDNTGVATIGSSSGIVTGVSGGTSNISYTLSGGCSSIDTVTVNALPTITLGANPSITTGTTSANLPYSATTGSPSTYSVAYSAAAHTAGFVDVTAIVLPSTPIVLTVPGAAPSAVYSATLTVTGTCTSAGYPISITITPPLGGGVWSTLTHGAPHGNGGVMLVMTDGTILCKTDAGTGSQGNLWDKLTPDSHGSYLNGTWTTIAGMANDRLYFSSQVLRDGRVYVAGGEYGAGDAHAEVYNPVANTWSAAATSAGTPPLSDCNSELLPDGTVLEAIQSGSTTGNYIYNPTANTATTTGSCFGSHDEAAWIKLPDNSILQVDILSTNAERYIPSSGTWVHDAACPVMLYDPYGEEAGGALLLPNGNAFFLGATGHTAIYTPSGTSSPGSWVAGPDIPTSEGTPDAPCAIMVDGKVLLCASPLPRSSNHFPDSTSFYEYDYTTNSYTLVTTPLGGTVMNGWPTYISNMVNLPDGNVLYSYQGGGYYLYAPTGAVIASGQPTVNSIARVNCDTFTATGTLFNGISEGQAYGDDWQNASNYPIIRLTSGTNVYYSKVYSWNSTGVRRGAALDTVQFILPAGLPAGGYTLAVVANGNASAGTPFNAALTISPSAPSICAGSTVNLSDAWPGGTWTSGSTGIATVGSSSGVVAGVASGTATITYTFSAGCTSTVVVTVNALPTAITGSTSVCVGGNDTLSSTPGGGTWTSSSTGVATIGSANGVVSGVSTGTSNITYALSGGCSVNTTVTVNPISPVSGPSSVCFGGTITLSDTSAGGTWSSGNVTVATVGSGTGVVVGIATGSSTLISYTLGSGCFATHAVTVTTAPGAISGTTTACAGATTTLSCLPGGGAWTSGSTGVATVGSSSGIVSGVTPGTSLITYSLGTGCQSTTTVTVSASPGTITDTTTALCVASTTTFADTTAGGTWSSSSPAVVTVDPVTGLVTGVAWGTATISYTVGSCSATIPVTVDTFIAFASISGGGLVHVGSTLPLTDAVPGGTWSSSGSNATIGSLTGIVTGVTVGTVTISYGITNGCGANYSTRPVTVVPTSCISPISGPASVCVGSSVTLTDTTSGGIWSSANTAIATVGSGSGVVTGIAGDTVTIIYTVGPGCVATMLVTVNTGAAPITGTAGTCTGHTTTLSDATGGGTWSSSNTTIATIGSSTGIVSGISPGFSTITYSIGTGCTATITVTIHPVPAPIPVIGGGGYCAGGTGVNVGIAGSAVGINYQLYCGGVPVGGPVPGIGGMLYFGLQTTVGVYTVIATDPVTLCTTTMSGSVTVFTYALPNVYTVTGGGSYCSGGTGVVVGLSNSDVGFTYQLYRGGIPVVGTITAGTGAAISFGLQTVAGVYTVVAKNSGFTACTAPMSGSATISVNALPTVYTVTGGGGYCSGGTGVLVGLSNSDIGVNYQLYLGGVATGAPVAGIGAAISFGLQVTPGTYTVVATNTTTACVNNMSGSVIVTINALPTVYTVTGGGSYCAGGTGVAVGLSASTFGINYQLFRGGVAVGVPVAGTGAGISFGLQTVAGTYTVVATNATTGCVSNMAGSAVVSTTSLPNIYTVTGGGSYCAGGTGVHVGLNNSDIGTNYQLYLGASAVGSAMSGTGAPLDFGLQTAAGTYTVVATIAGTFCTANMTGSATITITALPTAYTVTGGGSYCAGGTGVAVGLSGSQVGVVYTLFDGAIAVATGSGSGVAISFGTFTAAGIYTVVANFGTPCVNAMTGSVTISINPLPTVYAVTGGGSYCTGGSGVTIGLSGSNSGVNYQLFNGGSPVGAPVAGTGAAISFGTFTVAGTYTVVATNAITTCSDNMSGSATITISSLPNVYAVTGGGSYCSGGTGVAVGLGNSDAGVNYQLYIGGIATGSPVSGIGGPISFGLHTTAGTYTVVGTNATSGCTIAMSGSVTITINPLPVVVSVTGGGGYCAGGTGVGVGLSASVTGINYQLYLGGVPVGSPVAGIGAAISFGLQTTAGTYTVVATNATTGCTSNMSGSAVVTINPLPNIYAVTGGGSYCSGGTGVVVGLSNSDVGIHYQLYRGGVPLVGTIVSGTGAAISFGLQTVAGIYKVVATNAGPSGCADTMSGTATITINPLPTVYTVTGGGGYCAGGSGVLVGLSNSDIGTNYALYQGGVLVGATSGTGAAFNFGMYLTAGTYTVVATNTVTGCTDNMSGSATITINPLPTIYAVTGGGTYCAGGTGVAVGLMASTFGINYQLYRGGVAVGSPVAGTGAGISFGLQTVAGTYTVVATNATTGCVSNMSGSAVVSVTALPIVYTVTGGGSYCAGGIGLHVGLSSSAVGTSYQLYRGGTAIGSPMTGTGAALDFGLQTTAGTYTVVATITGTLCTINMSGSAVITVNPLPTVYNVIGGGSYCVGGAGVHVKLSGSNTGINYQLFNGGVAVGSPMPGTGTLLDFGLIMVPGIYTVVATNSTTGCTDNMAGSVTITVNPLPIVYSVTGGGAYCAGGSGVAVGLSSSQVGVNYQLFLGGFAVGSPIAGTGIAISFGLRTVAGVYTVVAVNATTGCTSNMSGSVTVTVNPLPNIYTVTGGGSYCSGGVGVAICISNSDVGISYQLYRGTAPVASPILGTGFAICFPPQTVASTYTIIATNTTTGCTSTMSGSATVTITPLPAPIPVTGGGSYCAGGTGVAIGLAGSVVGVSYQLMRGVTLVGSPLAGTGTALNFGLQTIAGTYTVVGTNTTTGCSNNMTGSVTITVNPIPIAYTVTGGGSYCVGGTGLVVGLSNSTVGVKYRLYLGGTPIGTYVYGSGSSITFGLETAAGTYTVVGTDLTTGCTANMTGSVTITVNPLPTVYNVIGGGSFCAGGTGVHVKLTGSDVGTNYQLRVGGVNIGGAVAGIGALLDFGVQTTPGVYTVVATNATTTCTDNMSGSVTITVNPLPTVYTVTGGGSYCTGLGVHVGLSGSNTGISYQLFIGGTTPVGSPLTGTGAALDFGAKTVGGTYTVVATNTTTGCTSNMAGSAVITTGSLPTAFTVTGGGSYCAGGTGLVIGLNGSTVGVSYQLYLGATAVGTAVSGTGVAISFGLLTTAGTYTVVATNTTTGCTATMTGSATITVNPLPTLFTVTGGGTYCTGGTGVHIGLSGSTVGVTYNLLLGATVEATMLGSGGALDFGLYTSTGTYTVVATNTSTGCTATMTGSATIGTTTAPTAYTVTGGGTYCSSGTGVTVGLSGSQIGVTYQLYLGGAPSGSPVTGTGSSLSFGLHTASGTYTVVATATGTVCSSNMTGSVTISISALPAIDTVTGGGTTCAAGPGIHVGLNTSTTGVSYQLYSGGVAVGSPLSGTGSSLDFGPFLTSGTYAVYATNTTTGCSTGMYGSATVIISTSPVVIAMTGGGAYCAGGTGVHIGLAASATGVNYQLYLAGSPVGAPVAGIGAALDFGLQTTAGTYTATGTYAGTSCSSNMSGSETVTIFAVPTVDTVTGGGGYCSGGSGVHIGLSNSTTGISYKLFLTGTPVISLPGTGAPLDFGLYSSAGTYTIVASNTSTGCTSNMYGSATVSINPNPFVTGTIYTVAPAGTITLTGSIGGGSWTSNDTTIATIGSSSGVVTGVALGTTAMTYTLSTGCWGSHIISVTPTGHREGPTGIVTTAGSSNISVTPNPNHGTFNVKGTLATTGDEEVYLEMTNMIGQVIYSEKVIALNGELDHTIQLNGAIPNGMYLLSLRSASENHVFHIVVEQ